MSGLKEACAFLEFVGIRCWFCWLLLLNKPRDTAATADKLSVCLPAGQLKLIFHKSLNVQLRNNNA